jgi:hypothetical protein
MFGMLMGTLQQFQRSSQSDKEKVRLLLTLKRWSFGEPCRRKPFISWLTSMQQVLARRESIAKKIEEKETQAQIEAREMKARLRAERMEKVQLLRKLRDERAQALLVRTARHAWMGSDRSHQGHCLALLCLWEVRCILTPIPNAAAAAAGALSAARQQHPAQGVPGNLLPAR